MSTVLTVLIFVLCAASIALLVASIWLAIWRRGIHRRALRQTARESGVSEEYLSKVLVLNEDLAFGRIDGPEWARRAVELGWQYPKDSGIRDLLRESEGLQ